MVSAAVGPAAELVSWPIPRCRQRRASSPSSQAPPVVSYRVHHALAASAKNPIFPPCTTRSPPTIQMRPPVMKDHLQQVAALVRRSQERKPHASRHLR
jgi:hypothetical protein